MNITKDTKLKDLLSEYPWLKDEITKVSDQFKLLNRGHTRRTDHEVAADVFLFAYEALIFLLHAIDSDAA